MKAKKSASLTLALIMTALSLNIGLAAENSTAYANTAVFKETAASQPQNNNTKISLASKSDTDKAYAVEGGNIYYNPDTGEITDSDWYITSAVIPDTIDGVKITSIGDSAFRLCDSLTSVSIPNGVLSIGDYAFFTCNSLTSVSIPDSVSSIGDYAFFTCNSLTSVSIPDSVSSIGKYPFLNCYNLKSINVGENNTEYASVDGILFSKDKTKLLQYPACLENENYAIPDDVSYIENYAFQNCGSLTSISIPNSVSSIGDGAFAGCYSLTSISIPNSVSSIGEGAFSYCKSLASISIPDSVSSIGDSAFSDCDSLASISIPDGVSSIGESTFSNCKSLASISIPDSVSSIGDSAFSDCDSLASISIPDSVSSIGKMAFYGCKSLTSIIIPDSVSSIGNYAFQNCGSLTSISISDSVSSIGDLAFFECSGLTSINVGENNTEYASIDGILFNKDKTTLLCYPSGIGNENYTIPNSVSSIGNHAFACCESLASITIPNSVSFIGDFAFAYCESLTNITIPDSVPFIGEFTFADCENLTNITIPNSVSFIERGAFDGCKSLTSITIPDSVSSIGYSAFDGCNNLTILCYKDSYAEDYAMENYIPYEIIEKPSDSITGITLDKTEAKIETGSFIKLSASVTPETAESKNIIWRSSNKSIAEVHNGVVIGIGTGNAVITAESPNGEISAQCSVTITDTVSVPSEHELGDVDQDGIITAKDAAYVLKKALNSSFEYPVETNK